MIEQLIVKMQEQANEEATKQGWCDSELASNKATLLEKGDQVEALKAEMDELSSAISKLGEELVTLKKDVAALDAAMANATEMRREEKEKNAATVRDAKEAQEAVAQALSALKDFYGKARPLFRGVRTCEVGTALVEKPDFADEPPGGKLSRRG